ncbi:hypothetical protein ACFPOA_05765 [Lysobacter niabensis]|uniref:hypothetical protein n=1 Tax=Agrilutibacter niabensis TaxID=380628 RepID=UPI00360D4380
MQDANAEALLQRLDGAQKSGNGWRARCPVCSGTSRKLSIAESHGRILVHCFAGCQGDEVLAAVGLRWADLHPPRQWPQSRDERDNARRAIRETGITSAVEVLALEAAIVEAAACQVQIWECLSAEDAARLNVAVERLANARSILSRAASWRPAV